MLMDTGGNSGSQSSTLIIRGLALGEIDLKDAGKVMLKEFRISIVVGLILAVVNFFRIYLFDDVGIWVSLTVSITLFVTVIISKVVGGILPMIAKKNEDRPSHNGRAPYYHHSRCSKLNSLFCNSISNTAYIKINTS